MSRSPIWFVGVLALGACGGGESRSPFALWDLKAGMPFSALDSIALHDQKERFACVNSHGKFRVCSMQSLGAFGTVQAIIDSTDKAVLISFLPAVEQMGGFSDMVAGLQIESRRVRALWNRVATAYPDPRYRPPARAETWSSDDKRWGAAIIWRRDGFVEEFRTYDQRAVQQWDLLATKARTDSITRAAEAAVQVMQSTNDPALLVDLIRTDLERLVDAQISFHDTARDYADDPKQLGFAARPKILITIGGADPFGWWARATHRDLPNHSCTVWMGEAPNRGRDLGPKESEPACTI